MDGNKGRAGQKSKQEKMIAKTLKNKMKTSSLAMQGCTLNNNHYLKCKTY